MTNWKKCVFAAVLVTAAGSVYLIDNHRSVPSDLRDAVADGSALEQLEGSVSDAPVVFDGNTNKTAGPVVMGEASNNSVSKSENKKNPSDSASAASTTNMVATTKKTPPVPAPAAEAQKSNNTLKIILAVAGIVGGFALCAVPGAGMLGGLISFCCMAWLVGLLGGPWHE